MASFKEFRVLYQQPNCLTLKWDIQNIPTGYAEHVTVQRSESPEGPWETLARGLTNVEYYNDRQAPLGHTQITIYYRLYVVLSKENNEDIELVSAVEWLRQKPAALQEEINYRESLLLRNFGGEPAFLLIRKTWGPTCSVCYDEIMGKTMTDNCHICYNTRRVGGYFDPIEIWISRNVSGRMLQDLGIIKIDPVQVPLWTLRYPTIKPGDVIADAQNFRYTVESIPLHNQMLDIDQKQVLICTRIPANDIICTIQLPATYTIEKDRDSYWWKERAV
jgi:hypothetical protein